MNNAYFSVAALIIIGGLASSMIASADETYVQFPTGLAAWSIIVTPSSAANGASSQQPQNRVLKIDVAQDSQKRRSEVHWSDGKIKDRWDVPGQNVILAEDSNGHTFTIMSGDAAARVLSIPFTADAFEWVKPQYLQEKDPISYQGKSCMHYKGTVALLDQGESPSHPILREAWIDSKTLQPVALDDGTELGIFTFSKNPPPALSFPPNFQNTFTRFEEGMGIFKPVGSH